MMPECACGHEQTVHTSSFGACIMCNDPSLCAKFTLPLEKEAATYDSQETDELMTKQLSEREDYGVGVFPHHDYPENSSDVRPWSTPRHQQELWNRFKEWWWEKWHGKEKEKRKVGREEPLTREDKFHITEDQTGSEGFWAYKQLPYVGAVDSPAFFNAMPMEKEAAYEWNFSPMKEGEVTGRMNWLIPAILDQTRVKSDKWDPSPLSDGDLAILKNYVKKGVRTDEEFTREKNYYREWHSGKWSNTDKNNIVTEVLERVTAAYMARYNKKPPIPEFRAPFRVGDYVRVTEGEFRNFTGKVTKVDRELSSAYILLTLFGVDSVHPIPFKHLELTQRPPALEEEVAKDTREYVQVQQELENILGKPQFGPGHWQAFMHGISPSGPLWHQMIHKYRSSLLYLKRFPSREELRNTFNKPDSEISKALRTLYERAVLASTTEGALKLRQQELPEQVMPKRKVEPLPIASPELPGRAGRPQAIAPYVDKFPLPQDQFDSILLQLPPKGRELLKLYQDRKFPTMVELSEKLGVERGAVYQYQKQIIRLFEGMNKVAINEYANHHVSITFEFMQDEIKVICSWDQQDFPPGLSEEQTLARIMSFLEKRLPVGIAHFRNAKVTDVDLINRMVGIIIPIGRNY